MLQLNTASLYQVMRDFHTLTQIRIVIFDDEINELLAYPQNCGEFCALLRSDAGREAHCRASDRSGCMKCAQTRELAVYRCHAGLTEAVVPIMDKNDVLAYVMFGQIVPEETCDVDKNAIRDAYPALSDVIERIPVKSSQELGAAATVLQAITSYMMMNRWVVPSKSEFIRQIDRYIEDHLDQTIAVEDICEAFRIGRTKLYETSMDYLGCGLAEYIRKQKIHHAQNLLLQTDMSVAEVAYAVGFSDYNYFSRVFRQLTGTAAREYRKTDGGVKEQYAIRQSGEKS